MSALWPILVQLAYLACAACALAVGGWAMSRRTAGNPAVMPQVAALALTACWALAAAGLGGSDAAPTLLLSLAYLAWLWLLNRLFAHDARDKSVRLIRPVVIALGFVELMQVFLLVLERSYAGSPAADLAMMRFEATFRVLFCIGALVLVHNLYAGASALAREALRWPAAALALLWLYDLNLWTVAYLGGAEPRTLIDLRPLMMIATVAMLSLGLLRNEGDLRFAPSRSFAFQSFSLLMIGGYLVFMLLAAQGLSYAGGELARLMQTSFVALAGAIAVVAIPSRRLRGWIRVTLSKHLFQHRFDYRAEWLRFNETMGRAGPAALPLRERIVQAVADIADSPSGLLLTPREEGGLGLDSRWQWPGIEVPAEALSGAAVRYFEDTGFIVDLDRVRAGRDDGVPLAATPDWLRGDTEAWAMVPLVHFERLVGVVVLARPALARSLDWEDFDLLGIVGRQLASYLAEQASQDALGEALRFDEFNRRIAFVMHDIKNLASQLSLLARNAEKHADNPAFRADMLLTLRNSADKLQALLARLGRYGAHGHEALRAVAMEAVIDGLAARYAGAHDVLVAERQPCFVRADAEALEQALVHLVHNAVEASADGTPVLLALSHDGARASVEIVDSGCGMSPEFVRTRLFKPFHSSKPGGFGIGAFEARELIRAMGGQVEVESREGLGTRFRVVFPLARESERPDNAGLLKPKVA